MIKISNREIIDVLKYSDDKVILVEKKPNVDASGYGVNYFILNFSTGAFPVHFNVSEFTANRKCSDIGIRL